MSLSKKVFFNTSFQIAGRVLTTIIGLVTFGLLTRYLGVAGYGEYTTVFAYNSLLVIVADFGSNWVALREISTTQGEEKKIIFQNVLTLRLLFAVVVAIIMLSVLPMLDYSLSVKGGIMLVAIAMIWLSQTYTINSYLQSEFIMYKSVISDLISRVLTLLGIIFVLLKGYGLIAVFIVTILGFIIYFLINLLWIKNNHIYGFRFDRPIARRIFRESFWMGIVIVLAFTYFKIDTIILSLLKDPVDVGIYGAPYKVVEILLAIPAMFLGNVFPALSQYAEESIANFQNLISKSFDALTAISLPILSGVIILASPIIELAAGKEYLDTATVSIMNHPINAAIIMQILMVAVFLAFWVNLFNLSVIAIKQQKALIIPYAIASIFNIAVNLIFIPYYSYLAAAVTTVLSEIIVLLMTYQILKKNVRIPLNTSKVKKIIITTVIMTAVVYLIRDWNLLVVTITAMTLYAYLLFGYFRIFNLRHLIGKVSDN